MTINNVTPTQFWNVSSSETEPPLINTEEIRSILYLGIRGNVTVESEEEHSIDTYA